MSKISIVAALADDHAIGYKMDLPWHLPADLKRFKQLTTGHAIIMGKRTLESLPNGPLPNRKNIVLTSLLTEGVVEGYFEVDSVEDAIEISSGQDQVFVIGGSSIYNQFMEYADSMYLTWVHGEFLADTYFPEIDPTVWKLIGCEEHPADEKNQWAYSFCEYERI